MTGKVPQKPQHIMMKTMAVGFDNNNTNKDGKNSNLNNYSPKNV